MRALFLVATLTLAFLTACHNAGTTKSKTTFACPRVIFLQPGQDAQDEVQSALLRARPGDVINLAEGIFEFTQGLSLAVEDVTLRGQGMDKTLLSFKHQTAGSAGLSVTRGNFSLTDLSIDDAKGPALTAHNIDGMYIRRVRARWEGESKPTNGAFGLAAVLCRNVLIEDCVALGAYDAGIFVGQSQGVLVRRCRTDRNVAGIEIANCTDADVHENTASDNTSGILVVNLPGLQVKNGRRVRVFANHVVANNHPNFAPAGSLVASVPPGTGVMVLAADEVEVFKNVIRGHDTSSVTVASIHLMGRPLQDTECDPIPECISVHDNEIVGGGQKPGGLLGQLLVTFLGKPLPDILYDGVENPTRRVDGKLPPQFAVSIRNNGKATFANLHWNALDLKSPLKNKDRITRDLKPHDFDLPLLPVVMIREVR